VKKHYVIPFFIPHKGCPNQCVFCNQKKITGESIPLPESVPGKIEKYLSTMPEETAHIEVGFFGGSFTALTLKEQEEFLSPVKPFLDERRIKGVRLSTRPDCIDKSGVSFLKRFGVTCVELGVQSMSDKVLHASRRGHLAADTEKASRIIREEGLFLVHQMMLGLPLSSFDEEFYTAKRIKALGAKQVRIYPLVVIKETHLSSLWHQGEYYALGEDEAIDRAARLMLYFESNDIKVIRCGLHPSEGLLSGKEYLAGPFHPAFGHKAKLRMKELQESDECVKS